MVQVTFLKGEGKPQAMMDHYVPWANNFVMINKYKILKDTPRVLQVEASHVNKSNRGSMISKKRDHPIGFQAYSQTCKLYFCCQKTNLKGLMRWAQEKWCHVKNKKLVQCFEKMEKRGFPTCFQGYPQTRILYLQHQMYNV